MPNQEFAAQVAELAKKAGPPQATAVYDPDGDCIEFLARPEPFYAERIDDLITVYYSQETHRRKRPTSAWSTSSATQTGRMAPAPSRRQASSMNVARRALASVANPAAPVEQLKDLNAELG